MILQFKNSYLEKLFKEKAVPGKPKYGNEVIIKFKKTILNLQFLDRFGDLSKHKGLYFESPKVYDFRKK